jgi:hypothetical protein
MGRLLSTMTFKSAFWVLGLMVAWVVVSFAKGYFLRVTALRTEVLLALQPSWSKFSPMGCCQFSIAFW